MNITHVVKEDVQALKDISERAILVSVKADDHIKQEIIIDTRAHIDQNLVDQNLVDQNLVDQNLVDQNLASSECVFLKYAAESILGFILIQGFWNLSDLFVVPEKHGKGIGSALLAEAISLCEPSNKTGYIRVNSSANAEEFYRKHGFGTFAPNKEIPGFVVPLIYNDEPRQ